MSAHLQTDSAQLPCQWARGTLALPDPFRLESGQSLVRAQLAWQCAGPAQAPLVVVLGGISAHARCCAPGGSGWWESQCGDGKALDTREYRLLGVDWLGGSDGSTGPGSVRAVRCGRSRSTASFDLGPAVLRSGRAEQEFPAISSADQARALLLLINRLGVRHVHLLVGASYGGAVAQHLAVLLGGRLRHLALLCAAHRSSAFAFAFRHVQRAILELGGDSPTALALARELAILGYVTGEEIESRFGGSAEVVSWLTHHGAKFASHFNAAAYRCLGASLDSHRIDPAAIHAPTTLFSVREDVLVPSSLTREFAAHAPHCERVEISSPHGHDAFLKEEAAVAELLRKTLGEHA